MSTNSSIAAVLADGSVAQVFCHWDGGLTFNGKILFEHYTDLAKIDELLVKGNLSSLAETVEECRFNTPYSKCNIFESAEDYRSASFINEEFNYLFQDGEWFVKYKNSNAFADLSFELELNNIIDFG